MLLSLVTTINVFPAKKLLFQRESRSETYAVSSWALSTQIIEFLREAMFMALYAVILMTSISVGGPLWQCILVFIGANFAFGSIGIFLGAMARNLKEATLLIPGTMLKR